MTMRATLAADLSTFTMHGQSWSATFPVADLPRWTAFYANMIKRKPKQAENYAPTLAALEKVAKMLNVMRSGAA